MDRVDDATEFDQNAIAGGLDDAAAIGRNSGIEEFGMQDPQACEFLSRRVPSGASSRQHPQREPPQAFSGRVGRLFGRFASQRNLRRSLHAPVKPVYQPVNPTDRAYPETRAGRARSGGG